MQYLEDVFETAPRPWAVVGNGESIIMAGKHIDSFPTIVRFNHFKTDGYEDQVGGRITHWCVGIAPDVRYPGVTTISPILSTLPRFQDKVVLRPKNPMEWPGFSYSTGFALLYLLNRHQIPTIVFNMDGFHTAHYWDKNHVHCSKHNGNIENRLIEDMANIQKFNTFDHL